MNPEPEGYIKGISRSQTLLLPENLDQYVAQENEARFIDAFVDSLNLEDLGFTHAQPNNEGRPPHNPSDMLKLFIWGYLNQIRSSRKLERECHRNLEVIWLMKKLTPDFKTIADFRKDNVSCIKAIFKQFVKLCVSLELYDAELIAVDGSKFKAVNAIDRDFNQKTLEKRIKLIEESAARYLQELDAADLEEEENQAKHFWEDKVKAMLKKKVNYEALLAKMKATGQNEVALTDPECRLMKNRGRIEPCYNVQAAVDTRNHLIVDYAVTNEAADNNQLSSLAIGAKETLGVQKIAAVADAGFSDSVEIKKCVDNGIVPYVAQQRHKGGRRGSVSAQFSIDKFTYVKEADVYVCPAGQRLALWSHAVVQSKNMRIYRCKRGVCSSCVFFLAECTKNKEGRIVWRWEYEEVMDEVRARLRLDPEVMGERKKVVEHPFGTMKRAFNMGYLLLKGLVKVTGEVGFAMLAYNMRRALNILGVRALMLALV